MIPAEAIEAAAKAVWERDHPAIQWDVIGQARQYELRLTARAALEAAAPHIGSQALEEAASNIDQWIKAGADEPVHPYDTSEWLRARADNLLNTEGEK